MKCEMVLPEGAHTVHGSEENFFSPCGGCLSTRIRGQYAHEDCGDRECFDEGRRLLALHLHGSGTLLCSLPSSWPFP